MLRKIICINEEKCDGCGICADACHEGAIELVNGKAKLMREDYCDGLGDCLPACPQNAISFEMREALAYDAMAVKAAQSKGCPGSAVHALKREAMPLASEAAESELLNWPVQIKLAAVHASYFEGANLLIAADCTAYAYRQFHTRFMHNHVTLIGCPKLDNTDYSEKLTEIIRDNPIKSVTIVKMEVPCCSGLEAAVKKALQNSGKFIPWQIFTISAQGEIIEA